MVNETGNMKSIFVSSTFRDMHFERDVIERRVRPVIDEFAKEFGKNVRFVDLRMGIDTTNEESEQESGTKIIKTCLQEIDNTRPYMIILLGERYGWLPEVDLLRDVARAKNYQLSDVQKSITELEIEYGAFKDDSQLEKCLFYIREPLPKEQMDIDIVDTYFETDPILQTKLAALKARIINSGAKIRHYSCEWNTFENQVVVPDSFADMVVSDVKSLFEREFERKEELSWQQREDVGFELLRERKASYFAGREEVLEHCLQTVRQPETRLFIMQGEAGSGKSTLMSVMAKRLMEHGEVFFFASGNGANSQTVHSMVKQIVYRLETVLGVEQHFDPQGGVQDDGEGNSQDDWLDVLQELMVQYKEQNGKPFYIVCDALDQLSFSSDTFAFRWLPKHIEDCFTYVVSCLSEVEISPRHRHSEACVRYHLPKLEAVDKPEIVRELLSTSGKQLHESVVEAIAKVPASDNPLYLSMMVQRLTILDRDDFKKIERAGDGIQGINRELLRIVRKTPQTVEGICATFINEISERINPSICEDIVAFIACSRRGLRERDLIALYTKDGSKWVSADFALLKLYLAPFLIFREDGRIDFLHASIRKGILNQISSDYYYEDILEYLKDRPMEDDLKISEIVWHAYKADDKAFLTGFLARVNGYTSRFRDVIGKELADIALEPTDGTFWVEDFIDSATENNAAEEFIDFMYKDFEGAFTHSIAQLEVVLPLMHKIVEVAKHIAETDGSTGARESESLCYLKLGRIYDSLGEMQLAIEMFEKYVQNVKQLMEEDETDDNRLGLEMGYRYLGNAYKNVGRYSDALNILKQGNALALRALINTDEPSAYATAMSSYLRLGNGYEVMGRHEKALEAFIMARNIAKKMHEEHRNESTLSNLADTYCNLGDVYKNLGQYENAIEMFRGYYDISQNLFDKFGGLQQLQELGYSCSRLGGIYLTVGRNREAIEKFEKGKKIAEQVCNELQTPVAMQALSNEYTNMGLIYGDLGQNDKALQMFLEAKDLSEQIYQKTGTAVALRNFCIDLTNLGDTYQAFGKYNEALESFEQAKELIEQVLEQTDAVMDKVNLAIAHGRIGNILQHLGDNRGAIEAHLAAKEITAQIVEDDEGHDVKFTISNTYNSLGNLYEKTGDLKNTLAYFEADKDLCEYLFKKVNNSTVEAKLAIAYNRLARVYVKLKQYDKAQELYALERDIVERAAKESDSPQAISDLAIHYCFVGRLYMEQRSNEKALEMFKLSQELSEKYHDAQGTIFSKRELAIATRDVAIAYQSLGDYEQAISLFNQSKDMLEEVLNAAPDKLSYSQDLALTCARLGSIYHIVGRTGEALELLKHSVSDLEGLCAQPQWYSYKEDLLYCYAEIVTVYEAIGDSQSAEQTAKKRDELQNRKQD